ncbi:FtsX-like permease family protein [Catenuloplanes atrovinosus]|uniref:ABC transport system permease protein n=1 Tax=Catenuloplanes atrovinosus TaxID=137266 RepID=A0AAE3YMK7_9ACTN|nr:FtsX-like permease family protein [Catenuloplanes atrovinosus]MDR7274596.1 putative ABC transport system permease protein [Catenuloplanes atrovinosus]
MRPAPHWPSVAGRARADAGPLALVAVVVAVAALLTGAVPPLVRATADAAVRDAVRRAGTEATIRVQAGWEPDDGPTGRVRQPELSADVDSVRRLTVAGLSPDVEELVKPPIASVISDSLTIKGGTEPRTVQLVYLANTPEAGGGPEVTWIAGAAPAATAEGVADVRYNEEWTVQAGLSESAAAALGVRPGDRIEAQDTDSNRKEILVSGVFRPVDRNDPAWRLAPAALDPVAGADGVGITRYGALLSRDSLPDARLALTAEQLNRTIWLTPDTDTLTWAAAERLAAAVITLKARSDSSGARGETIRWETQLDAVLRDARGAVDAAVTQASVLLIGVLTAAVLVLLLAADLLARRRAGALTAARQRGASLPDLAVELLAESVPVALLAAAAGLALARVVAPGVAWTWALPVVIAAMVAGPAFGTATAARATRNRRAPANRSARRWAARTAELRRITLEAAIVLAAAGAFVSLRQRGIVAGDDGLPASAPGLAAVAAGLLVLRLMPVGTGLALRRSLRSRRPLAVFGAARAAATSGRALPLLAMVTGTALATFALTLDATTARGLADGAWRTTGADARLDVAPGASGSTADLAARIAAAPGVRHVVAGQVLDGVGVIADGSAVTTRLIAVDAAAFRDLLRDTPIPQAGELDRLGGAAPGPEPGGVRDSAPGPAPTAGTAQSPAPDSGSVPGSGPVSAGAPGGGSASASASAGAGSAATASPGPGSATVPGGGSVPVLVRSGAGLIRPGMRLELRREGLPGVPLAAVGEAPPTGDAPDLIIADAAALAAAGVSATPDTIWVTGPGAADAVRGADVAATAVLREEVLDGRRAAPLTAGMLLLTRAAAITLVALGLLGLLLGAAADAPERWRTLSRLRTLGLRPRDTRRVAAGELLPPALAAAIAGPLAGLALAWLAREPLTLRLLTAQQSDPALVFPWWQLALLVAVLPVAAAVVAPVEAAVRRRRNLAEVLRIGG